MELDTALAWAADRKHAALITIRRDGRPQSSDIVYLLDQGRLVVSLTADRAKTRNMRRDPRVVLHITEPASWSYLSIDATVELSPVATEVDDATADALCEYYEAVAGEAHPDWREYRAAMVAEGRLLATITPKSVTGQVH